MVNEMGIYTYSCEHEKCEFVAFGIRRCKDCKMIIITDRGVEK